MTRTLVIHLGGIGDFLLACPAIARLAEDGPVELLGRRDRLMLAVAGGIGVAAHDISLPQFQSIFAGNPAPELARFLARFQRAIIWVRDAADIDRMFAACGITDVRAFPGMPPDGWARHASEYYLQCIEKPPPPDFQLKIGPTERKSSVVIHPGSGGRRKNWPIDNFLRLAESLGRDVTWLAGPAEEETAFPPGVDPCREDNLVELARLLAQSRLYIGNDSGITHLAAAVGTPTAAIFGPTDPQVWAPRGRQVEVVYGRPWPNLDAVMSSARRLLSPAAAE
jgi:hypothetical protein